MKRDPRLISTATLDFTASEEYTLPTYFRSVVDLYMDGATQYGRIKIVSPEELSERKLRHGDTGVPRFAAVVKQGGSLVLRFAPEPSSTSSYSMRLIYDQKLDALSGTNTTNFLLEEGPDLYLFASLSLAEGFLQEDQRVSLWKQEYEQAADEWEANHKRELYGGPLTPRPRTIIGEDV